MTRALRLLGLGAGVVIATFAVIALVMHLFNPPQAIEAALYDEIVSGVQVVDLGADPALKQALQDSLQGRAPRVTVEGPAPRPARGYSVPPREVKGFVQIEVKLDARGAVLEAKVVGAVPPGIYEQRALEQVKARRYAPITVDGRAVPGKVTEVIPFSVEAPARNDR